jgi:hypothetical protein
MKTYYVNKNENEGYHEVHNDSCHHLPEVANRQYLGQFSNCEDAVNKAKRDHYQNSDGCYYCCPDCDKH